MKIFKLSITNRLILAIAIAVMGIGILTPKTQATINYGHIIDDPIFEDQNSTLKTPSQIDNWLNAKYPSGCISGSFRTPDPTGWNGSAMTFGSNVTAGQAIYDAGRIYHINPQVLLTTLQKEQSAVTGGAGCYPTTPSPTAPFSSTPAPNKTFTCTIGGISRTCTYACTHSGGCLPIAVGYGCPGYCDVRYEGFSKQIIWAANTFRFTEVRSEGILTGYTGHDPGDENITYYGPMTPGYRQRVAGGPTNYYDGTYTPKDASTITIVTGATASLYSYTPFESGNNHFYHTVINWFGDTFGKVAQYVKQSTYPTLHAGQVANSYIMYKNAGNVPWYDDTNATANGSKPVHLAVTHPINSKSSFGWGWPNLSRPTLTFSAVYESDGTTLAADQHVVQPGQIAKFSFNITVPFGYAPGTYRLYLQPILEGASNWDMGGLAWFNVTTLP